MEKNKIEEWFRREVSKDQKEILQHKKKIIEEVVFSYIDYITLNYINRLYYENLPNKTSFPAEGFEGILSASIIETKAIIAPA